MEIRNDRGRNRKNRLRQKGIRNNAQVANLGLPGLQIGLVFVLPVRIRLTRRREMSDKQVETGDETNEETMESEE